MISWSYNDAQDNDIQDGYYKAAISKCSCDVSKKGAEMFIFTFKIEGSSFTPRKYQLTEPSGNYTAAMVKRDIANIAKCFSVPDGATDTEDFIGRKGFIKISHKQRKDDPEHDDIVISFPPPEKGRDEYTRAAQKKAAEKIAADMSSIDSWNPDEANIPF